jgi:imidazolonepropionase-like amidohydrolase
MTDLHFAGQVCGCCGFPEAARAEARGSRGVGKRTTFDVGSSPQLTVSEGASEVVPFTQVIDAIDLQAPDFARLARYGVTTVFVSPDSGSVIGARGAIVKTGGPAGGRVVSPVDAVKAAMGRDPISRGGRNRMPSPRNVTHRTRRPNTRMGVAWVFRKALYDARDAMADLDLLGGADTPPAPALEPLMGVLKGDIPLRIHARTQMDILTAVRLADEFGLRFTLEEGIEAYRCTAALKARDIPVIYGPIFIEPAGYRARSMESFKPKLGTAKALLDAGIRMALTAGEMRDEEGLAAQAGYAMRCGLSYEQALAAVTSWPAEILGVDAAVGTLAKGKSADLVLWSQEPFRTTSRIEAVLIGGETVYRAK